MREWNARLVEIVPASACLRLEDFDLRDADHVCRGSHGSLSERSQTGSLKFGRWLGRNKGRVVNGMKIFGELDPHTKQQVWWVGPINK